MTDPTPPTVKQSLTTLQDRLMKIEALAKAATPGPWRYTFKDDLYFASVSFIDREGDGPGIGLVTDDLNINARLYATEADMAFIAASRTDIPWLIEQLREAWKQRDNAFDGAKAWKKAADRANGRLRALGCDAGFPYEEAAE